MTDKVDKKDIKYLFEAYNVLMKFVNFLAIRFTDKVIKWIPLYNQDKGLWDKAELDNEFWRTIEFNGTNTELLMELLTILLECGITFDTSGGTARMWNIDWSFKVDEDKFNLKDLELYLFLDMYLELNGKELMERYEQQEENKKQIEEGE